MSQLETILWFGLGFAAATLIALFIGRAAWRAALRLGSRRMQRQVPATVAELQTERDSMRAEHAMISRKLEVRVNEFKARIAEQMAEVSRHRNRIEVLAADLARRDNASASQIAEANALREQLSVYERVLAERTENIQSLIETLRLRDEDIAERDRKIIDLQSKLAKFYRRDRPIEEKLADASEETDKLAAEIAAIDETVRAHEQKTEPTRKPAEPVAAEEAEPAATPSRLAGNVVSLAARIKALQKTISK